MSPLTPLFQKADRHKRLLIGGLAIALVLVVAAIVGDAANIGRQFGISKSESAQGYVPRGTLKKCQQVARLTGTTISSTWRSPSHNASVGGVINSMHTQGSLANPGACDFSGPFGSYPRVIALCRRLGSTEVLIHNAGSGLHAHCGWVR